MTGDLSEAFWNERYSGQARVWSGSPNKYLVGETADLMPGRALDAGSGEGADALWLAERGWLVTAVDFSGVALQRAAEHAREHGPAVAARITWARHDLTTWDPGPQRYDLVTAQYLHLPSATRPSVFGRLAAAVAPGGTLLIVGHHVTDLRTAVPRPPDPDRYFTGTEVAAVLEPGAWHVVRDAVAERVSTDPDGRSVSLHDVVFLARRPD